MAIQNNSEGPAPIISPQFKNDKRMKRGNYNFINDLMSMITDNDLQKIFILPKDQLQNQLMELSRELLNPNILDSNKNQKNANYWHLRDNESLMQAEKLVASFAEFTNDKFKDFTKAIGESEELTIALNKPEESTEYRVEVDPTGANDDDFIYDAYIDMIRTLMLQDQEGPPGSENLMQDLFNQYEGPAVIRQGACEVRISGAEFFPVQAASNRFYVSPNKRNAGLKLSRRT